MWTIADDALPLLPSVRPIALPLLLLGGCLGVPDVVSREHPSEFRLLSARVSASAP